MCKMFSSSGKPLSSVAESSYKGYNQITPLVPKPMGLPSFPNPDLTRKDLNRPHIRPSFSATILASWKICDTSHVSFVEKRVVSFFTVLLPHRFERWASLCIFPPSKCNTPTGMKSALFFNPKLLQCLPLKKPKHCYSEVIAIPQHLLLSKNTMVIDMMDWIVIL